MKKCKRTGNYDLDDCEVETRGCKGCYYFREEEESNESKIGKCTKSKSDKTNRRC